MQGGNPEVTTQLLSLVSLAVMVLLPLVPAYLLFKALPSTAIVTGPFQGLKLKLGGAFAGYFILAVLVFYSHKIWAPPPQYQVWEVDGTVTDEDGAPLQLLELKDIGLYPPIFLANPGGSFQLKFFSWPPPRGRRI